MQYPETEALFAVDDQYMIGSDLLVKPVSSAGVTETTVLFPTADIWYDVDTMQQIDTKGANNKHAQVLVASDIDKIPVYQRGGSIIPRKLRLRRSSSLMKADPYTLYVALDEKQEASGMLYMDDEETFDHEREDKYGEAVFSVANNVISNKASVGSGWAGQIEEVKADRMIERIIVMGVAKSPTTITKNDEPLEFEFEEKSKVLVIRKPEVSALGDWAIVL